jgi:hypothetical protein
MSIDSHPPHAAVPRSSRARLLLPVIGLGLIVSCVLAMIRSSAPPTRTASAVRHEIEALALRQSERPDGEDGGLIGPWWVVASGIDDASGRLMNFRITTEELHINARFARLIIDTKRDAFSFELFDVALTRLSPDGTAADGDGAPLLFLDHHVLGPAPFGHDIVIDELAIVPTKHEAK